MELKEVFGYKGFPRYEHDPRVMYSDLGIGIEIEAERYTAAIGKQANDLDGFLQYWELKPDGSLRNSGIELCSRVLFGADIPRALYVAQPIMEQLDFNWRAGIHVHTDVSSKSVNDLIAIFELYSVLEPLIFAWEGNRREQNNFCVPWYSCNTPLTTFLQLARRASDNKSSASYILSDIQSVGKYTALNVAPITNFGSIEYRHMQSTRDINRILQFVSICSAITRKPETMEAPAGELLSQVGDEELLAEVLGLPFLLEVPNYHRLLWRGVSTSNLIPTLQTDIPVTSLMESDNFPLI